ncbi:hypothetical protein GAY29_10880 [Azospirillum brasilense]|uniref:hypothetical protein n=1 Tax=Azospirillum brasilense TaxID=192 RepID=UPI001909F0A7|nr:hypothetical protein [Azospirillum brasilense]MBK3733613.1 hypothetical protein [Azospirillum brasilense]
MSTLLPRDEDCVPIPALRLRPGGAQSITVGAGSATNAQPFNPATRVIGIYATGPVFLRSGAAGVTATTADHYFPAYTYYDLSLGDERTGRHTHIAAVRAAGDCILYISEKE